MAKVGACWAVGLAGGFAAAWLLTRSADGGVSPWLAMAAGMVFVSTAAYLVGAQALRLHGYYLAMATLGLGVIVSIVFLQWEPVTGGTSGIYGIPSLQALGMSFDRDISMYYLVWTVVVALVAAANNIVNSRVGRAFRAVHSSEIAAATLGVDTTRYKVQVFILSAALASLAGSLYAHYVTFISPEPFGFRFSVELVVMVVVGGMASVWGAIFGAGTVTVLGEILRGLGHGEVPGLGVPLSDFDVVVFGLILMVIMVYLPAGLVRGVVDWARFAGTLVRRGQGR
ncbi:MAG: branched-chain amino acid ABC transporter permease [Armatimonadota bacterium]